MKAREFSPAVQNSEQEIHMEYRAFFSSLRFANDDNFQLKRFTALPLAALKQYNCSGPPTIKR